MRLNILFIVSKTKLNKKGKCPIRCRLTYKKKRLHFATGQFMNPNNWNSKKQLVEPQEPDSDIINTQLNLIKTKINQVFLWLQVNENNFTGEDIYRAYNGEKTQKQYNVIEYFDHYLKRLKMLVNIDIKQVTYDKFEYIKNDVKRFIKWKFKTNDLSLRDLKSNFLTELEYYYKTQQELKQITINKKIQRFRKVVKVAVAEEYLEKDPFILYKSKMVRTEIVFLSPEELKRFEAFSFSQPRLKLVQDLFIFSCYTGLPYRELMNLSQSNVINGFDDNLWIKMKREKTSKELSIPLLPKALGLLNKYSSYEEKIFPKISNQRYNSYLKEIAVIAGINKRLTTHMARRTFASTVLLYNNVPMEIVSELLGHSSMKITQDSYGKVVQRKVSLEIEKLIRS